MAAVATAVAAAVLIINTPTFEDSGLNPFFVIHSILDGSILTCVFFLRWILIAFVFMLIAT
jgi:hypothetical protein